MTQPCPTNTQDRASFAAIWKLTWPQMLMMIAHFLIGFVDVYVTGRIGREVQAAMGLITQSLFFFLVLAFAVANGSVAAISQSLGACRFDRAKRYVGLSLALALGFGALLFIGGNALQGLFLRLLQVPTEIRPQTEFFLGVYLLILPCYYLFIVTNALFRARQEITVPLYAMILVTLVNTVGDFGLGLGWFGLPNLGYKGVAWATFASVSSGALFNLYVLRRKGLLGLDILPAWRWIRRAWGYLFKVAWPSGAVSLVWNLGYLVLFAVVAALPMGRVDALAGMTAGMRVEAGLFLPGLAFNMTASILVGHYLGAGRPDEAKRAGLQILGLGVALVSLLTVVAWIFMDPITSFLTPEAGVKGQMAGYLVWNYLSTPFTVGGMILGGVMIGAGATIYNLAIFSASVWGVRLPLALLLGHYWLADSTGVWIAMFASQLFQCSVMLYFFLFKDWSRFAMRRGAKRSASSTPA